MALSVTYKEKSRLLLKNVFKMLIYKQHMRCVHATMLLSQNLRNIGVMAHIDAGKTTTTERMLFYSGHIKLMGDVDKGNTVTDYLPIEMERGITVQSAAVSFEWKGTNINLIDTPGHVDFTVEVERSLRVLDGAVAVFDAAKGVQAQSRTVWKQANRHQVPRLAFISKMDKPGASFQLSLQSLKNELNSNFVVIQIPLTAGKEFLGNIDIVEMRVNEWDKKWVESRQGRKFSSTSLQPEHPMWEKSLSLRENLIEELGDLDDSVAEAWLEGRHAGDAAHFPTELLKRALKNATLRQRCVPVLCGSSFKNIGVQQLLDAVVDYLPAPNEIKHDFLKFYGNNFTGMAFKVLHDRKLGAIVFTRVYSGRITNGSAPYNVNKNCSESPVKLLRADADKLVAVSSLSAGEIGIVAGLKHTVTGDTLVASEQAYTDAAARATADGEESRSAVLSTVPIPQPVFYRAIYATSHSQEQALMEAMERICREDPSVRCELNDDGNTILSGMGELHIEVVAERIKKEFKIDAHVGPVQVAYREKPTLQVRHSETYERSIFDQSHRVKIAVEITPSSSSGRQEDAQLESIEQIETSYSSNHKTNAARRGMLLAFKRGNLLGYPVIGAELRLLRLEPSKDCPMSIVSASATKCTREALAKAECILKQPLMEVEVRTTDGDISPILAELGRCHAQTDDIGMDGRQHVITATASVHDMKGFSSKLRSCTSGRADISMRVIGYGAVDEEQLDQIRARLTGSTLR